MTVRLNDDKNPTDTKTTKDKTVLLIIHVY